MDRHKNLLKIKKIKLSNPGIFVEQTIESDVETEFERNLYITLVWNDKKVEHTKWPPVTLKSRSRSPFSNLTYDFIPKALMHS